MAAPTAITNAICAAQSDIPETGTTIAATSEATVALLNPLGAGTWFWREVIEQLPPTLSPLAYDRRDTTAQNSAVRPWMLDDHVNDLEEMRRAAGLETMHVAGVAIGTLVGIRYATRYPQHVASLLLCNPVIRVGAVRLTERAAMVRAGGMQAILPAAVDDAFNGLPRDVRYHAFLQQFACNDAASYAHTIDALLDADVQDDLSKISCRCLVLNGELDKLIKPEAGAAVARAIAGACFRVVPQSAHFPPFQAPETFSAMLLAFVAGQVAS